MPEYYYWAQRRGVLIAKLGEYDALTGMRSIEHPDGSRGVISIVAIVDGALMSMAGASDAEIRRFLADNTVFAE